MSNLLEQLAAARDEVSHLERQVAAATCAEVGHRWKHIGGSCACCELSDSCSCSVPVHECETCGDCDYGENAAADVVKRACTDRKMLDDADFENRACEVCGAKTEQEASTACCSYQIPSGEYVCDGHPQETSYPDGRLRFISEIGMARINAWVDEEVAAMNAGKGEA